MENLSDSEDINRDWENIKENIKTSSKESLVLHELKQHKPWFDEVFLRFVDKGSMFKGNGYRSNAKQSNVDHFCRCTMLSDICKFHSPKNALLLI